jgi:clan AA aspartic protease
VKGEVDSSGRALLTLSLKPSREAEPVEVIAWVDTAFTGEVVIPRNTIRQLGLRQSAAVQAGLADGREVLLETYSCVLQWFGEDRDVEVVANEGRFPLLGIELLRDRRLTVDYSAGTLSLE